MRSVGLSSFVSGSNHRIFVSVMLLRGLTINPPPPIVVTDFAGAIYECVINSCVTFSHLFQIPLLIRKIPGFII